MKPQTPPPIKTEKDTSNQPPESGSTSPPIVTLDLELYLGQLEDWDIPQAQKIEFISTFWHLLLNFAELGFGIHPVQLAENTGRKKPVKLPETLDKSQEITAMKAVDMLYSKPYQRTRIIRKTGACKASGIDDSKPEGVRP